PARALLLRTRATATGIHTSNNARYCTMAATGPPTRFAAAVTTAAIGTHTGTRLAIRSPTVSTIGPSEKPTRNMMSSTVPSGSASAAASAPGTDAGSRPLAASAAYTLKKIARWPTPAARPAPVTIAPILVVAEPRAGESVTVAGTPPSQTTGPSTEARPSTSHNSGNCPATSTGVGASPAGWTNHWATPVAINVTGPSTSATAAPMRTTGDVFMDLLDSRRRVSAEPRFAARRPRARRPSGRTSSPDGPDAVVRADDTHHTACGLECAHAR